MVRVMAHMTTSVEYGIHSLLWLTESGGAPLSARDLAEFQKLPPAFLAKILSKLEKAGLLTAAGGVRGGYILAREPASISFLQIVDAIEGKKPLFECQEIRERCALFDEAPPFWATKGVCSIHAVMLRAEKSMRDSLARESLADVAKVVQRKAPAEFSDEVQQWLSNRVGSRIAKPGASKQCSPQKSPSKKIPAPSSDGSKKRRVLINRNPEL